MNALYEQIDALCRQHQTTMTALCKKLNISRSVLSELRSGRTKELSVPNLRKIADYFHISVDSLSHLSADAAQLATEPEDYFYRLYDIAKPLNEENRKKLLEFAEILSLAQTAQSTEVKQLSFF